MHLLSPLLEALEDWPLASLSLVPSLNAGLLLLEVRMLLRLVMLGCRKLAATDGGGRQISLAQVLVVSHEEAAVLLLARAAKGVHALSLAIHE